jgi:cell division transport system ATP-binding protein
VTDVLLAAPLLEFRQVGKRYGDLVVLRELSFRVERNEFVWLVGPAGAGKTTVLRLISALEKPSEGEIWVAGQELDRIRRRTLLRLRRSLGLVLQEPVLLEDRSLLQNVALPLVAAGIGWRESLQRATAALERVGLTKDDGLAYPTRLSVSVRQRAALARAVVNRPALLLVDEPTAHLDRTTAASVLRLLQQFVASGLTVVCTGDASSTRLPDGARAIAMQPVASP